MPFGQPTKCPGHTNQYSLHNEEIVLCTRLQYKCAMHMQHRLNVCIRGLHQCNGYWKHAPSAALNTQIDQFEEDYVMRSYRSLMIDGYLARLCLCLFSAEWRLIEPVGIYLSYNFFDANDGTWWIPVKCVQWVCMCMLSPLHCRWPKCTFSLHFTSLRSCLHFFFLTLSINIFAATD